MHVSCSPVNKWRSIPSQYLCPFLRSVLRYHFLFPSVEGSHFELTLRNSVRLDHYAFSWLCPNQESCALLPNCLSTQPLLTEMVCLLQHDVRCRQKTWNIWAQENCHLISRRLCTIADKKNNSKHNDARYLFVLPINKILLLCGIDPAFSFSVSQRLSVYLRRL